MPMDIPPDIHDFFLTPPLLGQEKRKSYYKLVDSYVEAFRPSNIVEWLKVQEAVDNAWEAIQVRRLKPYVTAIEGPAAVREILRKIRPAHNEINGDNERLAFGFMSDKKISQELESIFTQYGLQWDCVAAVGTIQADRSLGVLDKYEGLAMTRRDAATSELYRLTAPRSPSTSKPSSDKKPATDTPATNGKQHPDAT